MGILNLLNIPDIKTLIMQAALLDFLSRTRIFLKRLSVE